MKTTKLGYKITKNPADVFRKSLRKKELKRNKKERKRVRDTLKNIVLIKKQSKESYENDKSKPAGGGEGGIAFAAAQHPPPPPPPPPRPPISDLDGLISSTGQATPPPPPFAGAIIPPVMMRPPIPSAGPTPPPPLIPDLDSLISSTVQALPSPLPSYVKSAASTVVKIRPLLAQHTPELTSMVPASVLLRVIGRETATGLPKVTTTKLSSSFSSLQKSHHQNILKDSCSSYMAFLKEMKALGALDF